MVRGLAAAGRVESLNSFEPLVRQRLLDRFARAAAHPITVVAAPAGFGKTVALTHFLDVSNGAPIRYSLREPNSSLEGFVRGLLEAAGASPGGASAVDELLRDRREAIAIDNLQLAGADALAFLLGLIERRDDARWILASRNPLVFPLATWLAYRRMDMPIDEVDLRFSADEALVIAHSSVPSATETDVEELRTLTGGWPTAFAFGMRLLNRAPSFERIVGPTRELVFSYLAEQVFSSLGEADRSFLLETAFLPTLIPEQLRAGGYADATFTLGRLQRLTGFIAPDPDGTFVVQSLFRDFLQYQAQSLGQAASDRTMVFAAKVLEHDGAFAGALELRRRVSDHAAVRRILLAHGSALIARGALEVVSEALAALPADERGSRPELIALAADLKARDGQFGVATTLYTNALEMFDGGDLRFDIVARLAGALCDCLDFERAKNVLARITGSANDRAIQARFLTVEALVRSRNGGASGVVLRSLREAGELSSVCGEPIVQAEVLERAAEVKLVCGLFEEARKDATAALTVCEREGLGSLAARSALTLARSFAATCEQKKAAWSAAQALRSAEAGHDQAAWLGALAELFLGAAIREDAEQLGELDRALELKPAAEQRPWSLASAFALRLAWGGDFSAAYELLQAEVRSDGDPRAALLRTSERALYAAGANAREASEEAIREWQALNAVLDETESPSSAATLSCIWIALASLLLGRAAIANNALREIERAARDVPPPLRELCGLARATYVHAETGAAHADVLRTLEATRQAGYAGYARLIERLPLPETGPSPRFGSLTRTEVRVLRLLAAGGTSKSIGAELGRSSQTVDSHVKAVIRKLGCSGRREAVALARQHGII